MIIFLSIFPILINSYSSSEFNWPTANTSVWLSAAAYCKRDTYTTRNYLGASSGFIATNVIYESKSDTNGYVGYRAQDSSIFVVFRGSNSIKNWLDNLDAVLTSYPRCDGVYFILFNFKLSIRAIYIIYVLIYSVKFIKDSIRPKKPYLSK